MNLVIVESPAKAKTIEKYLNSINELSQFGKFKVLASFGHIQDLPEKKTGIDTTTWTVEYVPLKTKAATIKSLKAEVKNAKMVYLASDMDLEGNAIAYHLKNVLELKKSKYVRVIFNEITKAALKQAFLNPTDIDMNMFAAQETRRILDRIVGYELSPLLWRRFVTQTLSAGRVQSAGLKMIVTRYNNSLNHNPESYLTCEGMFSFNIQNQKQELNTNIYNKSTKTIMNWSSLLNIPFDRILYNIVRNKDPWVITFKSKTVYKNPSAPFTTSKFQQEVYDLYRIPPKVAMGVAQKLYEGGFITYMRTDSVQLSEEAQMKIVQFIEDKYGAEMLEPRIFKTKQDNAQEAHEAIRPTDMSISVLPDTFNPDTNDQKIYSLIRRRAIASQMKAAEYLEISYTIPILYNLIENNKTEYYFYGKESLLIKKGYLEIYSPDINIDYKALSIWQEIIKQQKIPAKLESLKGIPNLTKATSLFNESSIIKSFEKEGIGRPSTYAKILDILYTRKYIEKGKCPDKEVKCIQYEWTRKSNTEMILQKPITLTTGNKETDYLLPTSLGLRVIEYLEPIVPFLLDTAFTSHMETDLDKIMKGNSEKNKVLNDFYEIFHNAVNNAKETMKTISANSTNNTTESKKLYPKKDSIVHSYNENLLVVKTKYGPSLLDVNESKWYSIKPFIDWKKITYKEVSKKDLKFIMSLPKKFENSTRQLCLGPYGFYIKEVNDKINYILPEEHWEEAYNNTLNVTYINSLQPHYSKKSHYSKENSQKKQNQTKK